MRNKGFLKAFILLILFNLAGVGLYYWLSNEYQLKYPLVYTADIVLWLSVLSIVSLLLWTCQGGGRIKSSSGAILYITGSVGLIYCFYRSMFLFGAAVGLGIAFPIALLGIISLLFSCVMAVVIVSDIVGGVYSKVKHRKERLRGKESD